ncbi:MAG: hypothetical protein U0X40_00545 [Ferruginibacter sp.]
MKKQLIVLAVGLMAFASTSFAQGGGFQRKTPEERTKDVMEKLGPLNLDKKHADQADSVFLHYYQNQQKMREEMMAGGNPPDRETMRANMQKLADERDGQLKAIFTEEQMKKWKDEIEPTTRPQRPPGGQGGQ